MENIKVTSAYVEYKTGVWFYAGELLRKHGLRNLGRNQYKLLMWLEEKNRTKIKNRCISAATLLTVPSCRNDIIQICYS